MLYNLVLYTLWNGVIQPGVIQPMEWCYTTYEKVLYNIWNGVIQPMERLYNLVLYGIWNGVIQPMERCYTTYEKVLIQPGAI